MSSEERISSIELVLCNAPSAVARWVRERAKVCDRDDSPPVSIVAQVALFVVRSASTDCATGIPGLCARVGGGGGLGAGARGDARAGFARYGLGAAEDLATEVLVWHGGRVGSSSCGMRERWLAKMRELGVALCEGRVRRGAGC